MSHLQGNMYVHVEDTHIVCCVSLCCLSVDPKCFLCFYSLSLLCSVSIPHFLIGTVVDFQIKILHKKMQCFSPFHSGFNVCVEFIKEVIV